MNNNKFNHIIVSIENEMSFAYINYSMSVIISRALPDVRDGLKPVHRRVLYAMYELNLNYPSFYKKSARVVGEILGKYHPHGDSSIYDAMVRMSQDWCLRYPLVDGQGNFGSIDGDRPAAMRYTEVRLSSISNKLIEDINKNTVNFISNFDDSLKEPIVFPSKFPNLIINGSSGIAVGMATNIAPHNLKEIINGIIAYLENNNISIKNLIKYIIAPDFPTGGIIYGYNGVMDSFYSGRGRVIIRGKLSIQEYKKEIIVNEIPYMINKSLMIEKTIHLINNKKIDGIYNIRDESDKNGLRIVYELKKDAIFSLVINNLYKKTCLQTFFNINNVALVNGKPEILNIKDLIKNFILHRYDIIFKRTQYNLNSLNKRIHILNGYLIVFNDLDALINTIKFNKSIFEAKSSIIKKYNFSDIQARFILNMRLQKITNFEIRRVINEYNELKLFINQLINILNSKLLVIKIIKEELIDIYNFYGDLRRTKIDYDFNIFKKEDIIPNKKMVITISYKGYLKRTPLSEYRVQIRGGVGSTGVLTKKDDFTLNLFIVLNHDYLLIFTELGRLYWKRVYNIPESNKLSKGRAIQNIINIDQNDKIKSIVRCKSLIDINYINNYYVIFCTEKGLIKKTSLSNYCKPRLNGINAIKINKNDKLLEVNIAKKNSHIIIGLQSGRVVRFCESNIRLVGRLSLGVKGITLLNKYDNVIGMVIIDINEQKNDLLVVSENGFGKRSLINNYRLTNRGMKGVKTINITKKTGSLIFIKCVSSLDELMIVNKSGLIIRMFVSNIRITGRTAQGVKLIKLQNNDKISSVEKIENF